MHRLSFSCNRSQSWKAVRILHQPSGVLAQTEGSDSLRECQARAMRLLRARLVETKTGRLPFINTGAANSDRLVRTYDYTRRQVRDHRRDLSFKDIDIAKLFKEGDLARLVQPYQTR